MEKIISINGKEVGFKATASTPLRYEQKFGRDLLKDIQELIPNANNGTLGAGDLNCFMDIAYIMAWQYDNTISADPNDWLDEFDMFDIYYVLPQIVELWAINNKQLEVPKKKVEQQSGR